MVVEVPQGHDKEDQKNKPIALSGFQDNPALTWRGGNGSDFRRSGTGNRLPSVLSRFERSQIANWRGKLSSLPRTMTIKSNRSTADEAM